MAPHNGTSKKASSAPTRRSQRGQASTAANCATTPAQPKIPAKRTRNTSTKSSTAQPTNTGLTTEELAIFNKMAAKIAATKKATKAAVELAIQNKNDQLLAAEEQENGENSFEEDQDEDTPLRKKRKHASRPIILDDDEREMAQSLGPVASSNAEPVLSSSNDNDNDDDALQFEPSVHSDDEDEEHDNEGEEDEDGDEDAEDCWGTFLDNGLQFNDTNSQSSTRKTSNSTTTSQTANSRAATPRSRAATPRSEAAASFSRMSSTLSSTKGGKVIESMFKPQILVLAKAAKEHMRLKVIYGKVFPPADPGGRASFSWNVIKDAAKDDDKLQSALREANKSQEVKRNLIIFAMYGRGAIIGGIIGKARTKVEGHYQLTGTQEKIKNDVAWLLKDGTFMYGGIKLEERTFDSTLPFGSDLILQIIQSQWFRSTTRAKSDLATTMQIVKDGTLPVSLIILVTAAIEHSLKEFSTGKAASFDFSEDLARSSYTTHLTAWKIIEDTAPKWAIYWPKNMFKRIMENSNINILEPETREASQKNVAQVDFSALEKIAELAEGGNS